MHLFFEIVAVGVLLIAAAFCGILLYKVYRNWDNW